MKNIHPAHRMQRFHVRVGHAEMTISASDAQQARQQARRQLSHEHPGLWDVIYRIGDTQIQVQPMQ